MPKARLIINPISGTRNKAGLDRMVLDVLSQLGWEVEVAYTKGHGDATRLALSAIEKGCDTVATEPSTKLPRLCVARGLFSAYCPADRATAWPDISAYLSTLRKG